MLSVVQSHLTLFLKDGSIFDFIFRGSWLKKLRNCSMCLGFWTGVIVSFFSSVYRPEQVLAIAGLGHVFYLLREKYLPCDMCRSREPISFNLLSKR